jgi:chorismate mutase/prephenate dehydratase
MLLPFAERRINLTKIESRPTKKKLWEYVFYLDFEGHATEPRVREALAVLQEDCIFLKVLGSYAMAQRAEA